MSLAIRILLLDDDPNHLEVLTEKLEGLGYEITACQNVEDATAALDQQFHFAIVDLFLAGEDGEELSNGFVEEELMPRNIAFGRMSSAPGLVPKSHAGRWVYDKRKFHREPRPFVEFFAGEIKTLFPESAS